MGGTRLMTQTTSVYTCCNMDLVLQDHTSSGASVNALCQRRRINCITSTSTYMSSLVPRPRGRRKDGLVSTARASAAVSGIFP